MANNNDVATSSKDTYIDAAQSRENAPEWKKQLAKELLKRKLSRFPRRKVFSPDVDAIWAADLMDMRKYEKQNRGNKYILVIIDLFSKKAWTRAMKNKTGLTTANAMKDVLSKGDIASKIWVDRGAEFLNANMRNVLKKYGDINMYSTHNEPKSCIAERFIRTLRHKIEGSYIISHSTKWCDILQKS